MKQEDNTASVCLLESLDLFPHVTKKRCAYYTECLFSPLVALTEMKSMKTDKKKDAL